MRSVCVFCGARDGNGSGFAAAARAFAGHVAGRRWRLVFGGGGVGLMGQIADAALAAGGEVVGVIPRRLVERELAHRGLSELRVVDTMHERKALMAELSDAFVALPGGMGTLEELFEVLTWNQLGLHAKPCGLLNVDGYFDRLLAFLDHQTSSGFLRPEHRAMVSVDSDPGALLDVLEASQVSRRHPG